MIKYHQYSIVNLTTPSLELIGVVAEPPGVIQISQVAVVDIVPRTTHCIHVLTSSSIGF